MRTAQIRQHRPLRLVQLPITNHLRTITTTGHQLHAAKASIGFNDATVELNTVLPICSYGHLDTAEKRVRCDYSPPPSQITAPSVVDDSQLFCMVLVTLRCYMTRVGIPTPSTEHCKKTHGLLIPLALPLSKRFS